jgi:hypothetical protein
MIVRCDDKGWTSAFRECRFDRCCFFWELCLNKTSDVMFHSSFCFPDHQNPMLGKYITRITALYLRLAIMDYSYIGAPLEFLQPDPRTSSDSNMPTYQIVEDFYRYQSLKITNTVITILFTASMLVHLWQGTRSKSWGFMAMTLLGTAGKIIGIFMLIRL